jgi:hypothetical protein
MGHGSGLGWGFNALNSPPQCNEQRIALWVHFIIFTQLVSH